MKKKKIFKGTLSFNSPGANVGSIRSDIHLGAVGLSMPIPTQAQKDGVFSSFEGRSDLASFGMLGNDPKYYEALRASDLMPKPEDFVEIPFRLLTATIVGAGTWKATDFSNAKVLKKSTNKLNGKGVYKDHETDTDNWVGIVNGVKWSPETTQNGLTVPAGIDGILAIDAKTNPKVARGALMGSLYSNSVTVTFDWEMSHEFENNWDFYDKLGTTGADGKMITRKVTAIHDYYETSLVWLGADPFSKARDENGDLKHIDESRIQSFSRLGIESDTSLISKESKEVREAHEKTNNYTLNFAIDKNIVSLSSMKYADGGDKIKKQKEMKEFLAVFVAVFGGELNLKAEAGMTPEQFKIELGKLTHLTPEEIKLNADNADSMTKLSAVMLAKLKESDETATEASFADFMEKHSFVDSNEVATAKDNATKVTELTAEVTTLKPLAEMGKTSLSLKKDEAVRLYKVAVGDNVDEAVVGMFNKASDSEINGLLKQYTKGVTEKFTGKCADCGSAEFSFQSSIVGDEGQGATGMENTEHAFTQEDFRKAYDKPKMNLLEGEN